MEDRHSGIYDMSNVQKDIVSSTSREALELQSLTGQANVNYIVQTLPIYPWISGGALTTQKITNRWTATVCVTQLAVLSIYQFSWQLYADLVRILMRKEGMTMLLCESPSARFSFIEEDSQSLRAATFKPAQTVQFCNPPILATLFLKFSPCTCQSSSCQRF